MGYQILELDGIKIDPNTKRFPVEISPEPHALNDKSIHLGKVDVDQLPDDVMFDAEHQSDPHTMLIDGRDVSSDGSKLDTIEVGAQVNNITNGQAASLTSGLHTNWHHHDDFYYRKADLQTSGSSQVHWNNLTNKPLTYAPSSHSHDDLYYTEAELDAGQLDTRYYTETEVDNIVAGIETFGIKGGVDTYSDLPIGVEGDIYIVRQDEGLNLEGFYRYDGLTWNFLARNTGNDIGIHNDLQGLNDGDYKHLTASQYSGLISGNNTTLHKHDGQYYTQTQITGFLDNKSDIGHIHDDRYYTEIEMDALLGQKSDIGHIHDDRYYTESELDIFLGQKSDVNHIHDDRYYTEIELSSSAGASLIGATLTGSSLNNVQDILEKLNTDIAGASTSLNEAYIGGRIIDVNNGPVKLDVTSTSAPLELTNKATAPSTGLAAGQITVIDNELFIYDGGRNKWLSPSKLITFSLNNNAEGKLLATAGGARDWNSGSQMIKDGTITSISIKTSNALQNKEFQLLINGAVSSSFLTDVNGDYMNKNVNINFNEGDIIQVYIEPSAGEKVFDPVVMLEICWRK